MEVFFALIITIYDYYYGGIVRFKCTGPIIQRVSVNASSLFFRGHICFSQWCSLGQNLKAKGRGHRSRPEAKAF